MLARTPAIVGTGPLLSSANALNAVSSGTMQLIGGPLGGILLAACGIKWLICADALSYLVVRRRHNTDLPADSKHRARATSALVRDLVEGARVLRSQPVARALLPVTVIFLAANASLSAVLIPLGVKRLGGSEHTGFLLSCLGVGVLLGAPAIRLLLDRVQPRNLLTASLTATAAAFFGLFTSSSLATALPAAAAVGLFGSMSLGDPADRDAAGHPERGARPGQRRIPHRPGGGHPDRRHRRALSRPGRAPSPGVATAASLVTLGAAALT